MIFLFQKQKVYFGDQLLKINRWVWGAECPRQDWKVRMDEHIVSFGLFVGSVHDNKKKKGLSQPYLLSDFICTT